MSGFGFWFVAALVASETLHSFGLLIISDDEERRAWAAANLILYGLSLYFIVTQHS